MARDIGIILILAGCVQILMALIWRGNEWPPGGRQREQ